MSTKGDVVIQQSGSGTGFFSLLTLIFITLKLTYVIDWSWWWVLSPLWLFPAIVIGLGLIALAFWLLTMLLIKIHDMGKSIRR
jgi:hypothetical protein